MSVADTLILIFICCLVVSAITAIPIPANMRWIAYVAVILVLIFWLSNHFGMHFR